VTLVDRLHEMAVGGLLPDLTILLDLDPEVGLARAWRQVSNGERSGDETRFENEALLFHQKVRDGYLRLASDSPNRFCVIDAEAPPETVAHAVISAIDARMAVEFAGATASGKDNR